MPASTPIEVHSGSGDLTASGLTGRVLLDTGSGDVSAMGLTGPAELRTGSGDVDVRGLSGTTQLNTGSGDITAEGLATPHGLRRHLLGRRRRSTSVSPRRTSWPRPRPATSTSPCRAGGAYHVEADPGSGDQQVDVKTDPDATSSIRANTSSGDVNVDYRN